MWRIILALSVALAAGSQDPQYELEFPSSKSFTYDYEGQVMTGLPEDGFAKSGLKVKCRAQISTASPRILFLKIRNIEVQEFNGIRPIDKFTSSTKLTKFLEKELLTPITFEYNHGQVGELNIPRGLSEITVNLLRGILNIFQLTIKKTQNSYIMQENGIWGLCHASYVIQEKTKANQMAITKSINLNDCAERERKVTGNAYFYPCPLCQQRNKNSRAAATYNYDVKATKTGGRLMGAEVREVHQFTPFNEIDGAVVVEARQRLVLAAVQEQIHSTPENNDYITKESLRYHFERKLIQTPIQLLRTKNAENQISTLLQYLVEHSIGPLSKVSPIKFLELVQHLRMASLEEIEGLWNQYSERQHYRRWILDAIPAIGNHFSLRFLKLKLKELSEFEAAQVVPLALHLIKADREAIAEAKALLQAVNAHSGFQVRKVAYLAYGSLVHKFCNMTEYCSEEALQPLHDLLAEAKAAMNLMDIILALKGLGNAGQATCIKRILKFLPRITSMVSNYPVPVQISAVLALKNIAHKHPAKIQDIALQLYMDLEQRPIIRKIAGAIILDNKPPTSAVMMIAKSLMKETDKEVGSLIYFLMKKYGTSVNPELHEMAAICNMAVAVLKSKYEATRSQFNSEIYYDTYSDSLMSGMQIIFIELHHAADVFSHVIFNRLKLHFMGVFTELLEIGYYADGLQELLMNRHLFSSGSGLHDIKKIMDMLQKLPNWKPIPSDEPLAFVYLKIFGHELFYEDLNKYSIENILKVFSSGRIASLQAAVKALQRGVDIHWSKPLLSSENRLIVPTCVGLPLETSLYYSSVSRVALQAQSHITPDPKDDPRIFQLLESDINLKTKFSFSMDKDIVFMIGVNTELIQAGMELRAQVNFVLPANVDANFNVGQKHFKMDFTPELPDNELLSIRSKAFAVTRNSEDLAAAKMTPIVAAGTEPNVLKQTFSPKDLSAGDTATAEGKFSAEVLSKEKAYWSEQPRRRPQMSDVSMCAKAQDLGFQVCLVKNCLTSAFVRNCPLYHMIGDHSVKVIFKPVHTGASVEKIQIEFQAGPGARMKMVRSVNVRRADGGIQELENPMDRMALSKLQKILGTSEVMKQVLSNNSTLSNDSSSASGNTSESSVKPESSMEANASKASQEHQHKQNDHKTHNGHHSKENLKEDHRRHRSEKKDREHHHKHHQHSKQELPSNIDKHYPGKHKGHNQKKEMEIHCKCWPENTGSHGRWEEEYHHKDQHMKGEPDSPRKRDVDRQHKGEHEEIIQERPYEDQHTQGVPTSQQKSHHRQHKGEHEKENQGDHHKHKQGDAKEQEHHHRNQHAQGEPTSQQKDHHRQHKGEHEEIIQKQPYKDQHAQKGSTSQQKDHHRQHKGEHEKENQRDHHKHKQGDAKEQDHHKDQHAQGGPTSQQKGHHGKWQNDDHHKDHESEGDRQHNGEHMKEKQENQGEHQEHKHKKDEAKEHKKVHHKQGAQEHHHKDQHESHQKEKQSLDSKESKRNCTCWRKIKDNATPTNEEQMNHQHGKKRQQSQGKAGDKKKCKFLSSESSSSSEDCSLSDEKHEPQATKSQRIQTQNSDSSNSSLRKKIIRTTKGNRKYGEENYERNNLRHQNQQENRNHSKNFKRHHKSSTSAFSKTNLNYTTTLESQHDPHSWISSNFLQFFESEIVHSEFESMSTLMRAKGKKRSRSRSEENASHYKHNLSEQPTPDFVLLVKALMSDAQDKGYQTTAYLEKFHAQVETVSLDQKNSWKTCFDASVSGYHKASAIVRWGKNCQDYRIAAQASTGQMAGAPAVQLLWQWKRLPSWLTRLAGSIMPFVPGVAYTLGFSELRRHNTPHQVTVRVATTADTLETILKTPEMTIYKQGISLPWEFGTRLLKNIPLMDVTALPTSLVKRTSEAVCKVDAENIVTFNELNLGCSLSPAPCYTVIAQDCSDQLRFLVAMKKMGQGFSTFEINVKLGSSDIKIHCDASEEFHIQLNGMWLLLKNDTYINERDCIRIHKNATTVTVKAPKNGVEQISFDGQSVKVQISPLMRGKTCGLCGNADYNQHNDWKRPNQAMAKSCNGLVHSWTVADNSCSCAMSHQYMMLEEQVIDEHQSTCYSLEPVLTCMKGCRPISTTPLAVAFHCLPKDSAIGLAEWQANPRESSEDLIKDIDVHTSCACTEECSATQQ
ncbi:vitellogenin-1-like [Mantella aurantiaca]